MPLRHRVGAGGPGIFVHVSRMRAAGFSSRSSGREARTYATALGALGTNDVLVGMYAGFILGAVFGVVLSRLKIVDSKSYAFGPYMVVGAVIGAAWGSALYG